MIDVDSVTGKLGKLVGEVDGKSLSLVVEFIEFSDELGGKREPEDENGSLVRRFNREVEANESNSSSLECLLFNEGSSNPTPDILSNKEAKVHLGLCRDGISLVRLRSVILLQHCQQPGQR
jgi:hypothetical protein